MNNPVLPDLSAPGKVSMLTSEGEITLGVLAAVQKNSALTQRSVARELGIALGLANTYLKRCVKKGYIKLRHAPANRYAYYLTPQGFAEKSRLTATYLNQSFVLFRRAREQCAALLDLCEAREWHRLAFHGLGDLYEIAYLCARSRGITPLAVIDVDGDQTSAAGIPVVRAIYELGDVDAVILTGLRDPQSAYDELAAVLPSDRVLALPLLAVDVRPHGQRGER